MTYEQYWDGDCELVRYYRKAHEMRISQQNYEAWLNGLYIYEALCNVSPVLHAFAKNGVKPIPYPSEPHPITAEEIQRHKEIEERRRFEKIKAKTEAWAAGVNARFAKAGGENSG